MDPTAYRSNPIMVLYADDMIHDYRPNYPAVGEEGKMHHARVMFIQKHQI